MHLFCTVHFGIKRVAFFSFSLFLIIVRVGTTDYCFNHLVIEDLNFFFTLKVNVYMVIVLSLSPKLGLSYCFPERKKKKKDSRTLQHDREDVYAQT